MDGHTARAADYARAIGVMHRTGRAVAPFFTRYDVLLTPTMCRPPHPLGVQFVAGFGDEATLFRLAAQLEAAQPWAQRRPPMPRGATP
jgi:Asp-tRNA(Asn)/Glu-tRNA(Gln) amidotransferase A subunit family amidase